MTLEEALRMIWRVHLKVCHNYIASLYSSADVSLMIGLRGPIFGGVQNVVISF